MGQYRLSQLRDSRCRLHSFIMAVIVTAARSIPGMQAVDVHDSAFGPFQL
jgi:hypothetical protein